MRNVACYQTNTQNENTWEQKEVAWFTKWFSFFFFLKSDPTVKPPEFIPLTLPGGEKPTLQRGINHPGSFVWILLLPRWGMLICFCNSSVVIVLPGLSLINHVATKNLSRVFAYSILFQIISVSSLFIKSLLKMATVKAGLRYYKSGREKGEYRGEITFNYGFSSIPQKKHPPKRCISFLWPAQVVKPEILLVKVALTLQKHFPGCYYLSQDHWKKSGIG